MIGDAQGAEGPLSWTWGMRTWFLEEVMYYGRAESLLKRSGSEREKVTGSGAWGGKRSVVRAEAEEVSKARLRETLKMILYFILRAREATQGFNHGAKCSDMHFRKTTLDM